MRRSRLIPVATFVTLVLAILAVSHELTYVVAHGLGQGYNEAMVNGGHEAYWGAFLATTLAAVAALFAAAVTQMRRLLRLSERVRMSGVVVRDCGSRPLLRAVARRWPRLMAASSIAFLVQENLERMGAGSDPGLQVVTGDRAVALPLLLLASLAVAIVAAIYRWRRDVLLAIVRTGMRSRRRTAPAPRPTGVWSPAATSVGNRLHGLRAPPA